MRTSGTRRPDLAGVVDLGIGSAGQRRDGRQCDAVCDVLASSLHRGGAVARKYVATDHDDADVARVRVASQPFNQLHSRGRWVPRVDHKCCILLTAEFVIAGCV